MFPFLNPEKFPKLEYACFELLAVLIFFYFLHVDSEYILFYL